jgi:hypothetical protein
MKKLDDLLINMEQIIKQETSNQKVIDAWKKWGMDYRLGIPSINLDEEDKYYLGFLVNTLNNEAEEFTNIFRIKEYKMDSNDRCFNCGYFDPDFNHVSGYCTLNGSDNNSYDLHCSLHIIL